MSKDFVDSVFRCGITMLSLFSSGCTYLALGGLLASLVIFLISLAWSIIIGRVQTLCLWRSCGTVSRSDVAGFVFVDAM